MSYPRGQIITKAIQSEILSTNQVGLETNRPIVIYQPHKDFGRGPFPVLYCLAPWTQGGRSMMDWKPFGVHLPGLLDELIATGRMPPCMVVSPDLFTRFGGSQYINSEFMGRHADFIVEELFNFIEQHCPVLPGYSHRAAFGISSGGFGALRLAMDRPRAVAALACHSGDMGFDLVYGSDLAVIPKALARFAGDPEAYMAYCLQQPKMPGGAIHAFMMLGMAATYSPQISSSWGYDLPIDWFYGRRDVAVWQRWLDHDPVVMVNRPDVRARLNELNMIYIEVGQKDQYNLQYGARQLHQRLNENQIRHQYVEFDDNHSGLTYRFRESLPLLAAAVKV